MRKFTFLLGAAIGAASMYYFDPVSGRSRRATARDRLEARRRQAQGRGEEAAGDASKRRPSAWLAAHGPRRFHSVDDRALSMHLKSVLAGIGDVRTDDVNVDVVGGVATLRGEVAEPRNIDTLVRAAQRERGVERVECYLHLPGEPAPNKAAALTASEHARRAS